MTAELLHNRLVSAGFAVSVEGSDLLITPFPPPEFDVPLRLLHTGVRSLGALRAWHGSSGSDSPGKPHLEELDPARLIPAWCGLVCVAGDPDGQWDRLRPFWRIDRPEFFDQPKAIKVKPKQPRRVLA